MSNDVIEELKALERGPEAQHNITDRASLSRWRQALVIACSKDPESSGEVASPAMKVGEEVSIALDLIRSQV